MTAWDEAVGGRTPQIIVALEAHRPEHPRADLSFYERAVAAQLFDESNRDFSAFGGYSGGPLVLLTPSKNHLIGFVKQGGRMYGEPRVFASSLFDVLRAFSL